MNLLRVPTDGPYAFGRYLLAEFFSAKEMKESVIFETQKSKRPALCPEKISFLMGIIYNIIYVCMHIYIIIYI